MNSEKWGPVFGKVHAQTNADLAADIADDTHPASLVSRLRTFDRCADVGVFVADRFRVGARALIR
jgi:hypothetical protein